MGPIYGTEVYFNSQKDKCKEKQEDPLLSLLMQYQLRAPQQAASPPYEGVKLWFCQEQVRFLIRGRLFLFLPRHLHK